MRCRRVRDEQGIGVCGAHWRTCEKRLDALEVLGALSKAGRHERWDLFGTLSTVRVDACVQENLDASHRARVAHFREDLLELHDGLALRRQEPFVLAHEQVKAVLLRVAIVAIGLFVVQELG